VIQYSNPPYKRWGSVAELTCHLQDPTPSAIRFSRKIYRPSPTKDVTEKDPPYEGTAYRGEDCTLQGFTILERSRKSFRPLSKERRHGSGPVFLPPPAPKLKEFGDCSCLGLGFGECSCPGLGFGECSCPGLFTELRVAIPVIMTCDFVMGVGTSP
jgi:hypothetical protein